MKKAALSPAKGLRTSTRRIGSGDAGYLMSCKNVVPKDGGIMQQREGRGTPNSLIPASSNNNRLFYSPVSRQVFLSGTNLGKLYSGVTADSGTEIDANSYTAHTTADIFDLFLGYDGLKRLNDGGDGIISAGIPEAVDIRWVSASSTTPGWAAVGDSIGYYALYRYDHPSGRFFRGAPSGRLVAHPVTVGGLNPYIRCYLTKEFDAIFAADPSAPYFLELYRTEPQPIDSTTAEFIDPGREAYLIKKVPITSSDVTTGWVDILDDANPGTGGETLYTSPSQQGAAAANLQCPLAAGVTTATGDSTYGQFATIGNVLVGSSYKPKSSISIVLTSTYANAAVGTEPVTKGLGYDLFTADTAIGNATITNIVPALSATMHIRAGMRVKGTGIATGSTIQSLNVGLNTITLTLAATANGAGVSLQANDIIRFTNTGTLVQTDFFAAAATDFSTNEFLVQASDNIPISAQAFCYAVSGQSTIPFAANYIADSNELAGVIYIRSLSDRSSTYTLSTTRTSAFAEDFSGGEIKSKASDSILCWSKEGDFWAWPGDNQIQLPSGASILGLSSVGGSIIVWTSIGSYIFFGQYGNFGIEPVDESAFGKSNATDLVYAQSVVLNNLSYSRTVRGLVASSETNTQIVSQDVSNLLAAYPTTYGQIFVNRADQLIYVPLQYSILVYSAAWGCWTFYDGRCYTGVYNAYLNTMVFSLSTGICESSLNRNLINYSEGAPTAVTINSVNTSANTIVLNATLPGTAQKGDTIVQGAVTAVISGISGTTISLVDVTGLTAASASFQPVVDCYVTFCPIEEGSATTTKHNQYATLLFDGGQLDVSGLASDGSYDYVTTALPKYVAYSASTNLNASESTVEDVMASSNLPHIKRFIYPVNAQRSAVTVPTVTFRGPTTIRLASVDIDYEPVSQNVSK